jgi:hypothetical protein
MNTNRSLNMMKRSVLIEFLEPCFKLWKPQEPERAFAFFVHFNSAAEREQVLTALQLPLSQRWSRNTCTSTTSKPICLVCFAIP